MKITIEPETDEEKRYAQTLVLENVQSLGIVAVYQPADPPHEPFRQGIGNLGQVMRELPLLNFALTQAMLVAGAKAQQQPIIQVARPNMPQFPAGNDRMRGK